MAPQSKLYASTYAQIGSALLEPDSRITALPDDQKPTWYRILTPSVKDVSHNEVMVSHFAGASEQDIEQQVLETVAEYKKHGVPVKWLTGPMASPASLTEILRRHANFFWWFRGMALDSSLDVKCSDQITVEKVGENNFDEFLEVFLKGWGRESYRESAIRHKSVFTPGHSIHRYFLARINGVPVGSAGTILKPGYGYLVGAVILEKYRGSGAYRSLVQARLKDLAALGLPFAVTMAREATSAPILEKLGAETTYRGEAFRFDP